MSLWRLRLSMIGSLTLIIGISTLFLALLLSLLGSLTLWSLIGFVVVFNILQWLIAPYIINIMYHVREANPYEHRWLYEALDRVVEKSGLGRTPKLMIANLPIPNAFAYGSPLTGPMIAITSSMLTSLSRSEIEAVIGHEVGHLKHRDVQVMMFVSMLPAIIAIASRILLFSGVYRDNRNKGSALALIGMIGMVVYFMLSLLILWFSRQREYYADRHSVNIVDNGASNLALALAKISNSAYSYKLRGGDTTYFEGFKTLFIADPSAAKPVQISSRGWELVEKIASRKLSFLDTLSELFSTHPHIVKRIRTLLSLSK
ncbi:MAG: zinc metalloprotease HtpX [Candidatus Methanomethylicia archaeon]